MGKNSIAFVLYSHFNAQTLLYKLYCFVEALTVHFAPDTHSLSVKGMITAQLKSQSNQTEGPIYIVRGLTKLLLGRPAIKQLKLISRIDAVSEQELDPFIQFPKLFTGLGILQKEYNIQLKRGAKPFAIYTQESCCPTPSGCQRRTPVDGITGSNQES